MEQTSEDSAWNQFREMWRAEQCEACQAEGPGACSCTKENAVAFMEDVETGERKYFCCVGCMLLQMNDHQLKRFTERQFEPTCQALEDPEFIE